MRLTSEYLDGQCAIGLYWCNWQVDFVVHVFKFVYFILFYQNMQQTDDHIKWI